MINELKHKKERRARVKRGLKKKIRGTPERPRLCVYRSNKHIYAQVIDDTRGHTLAAASSLEKDMPSGTKTEISREVGRRVAQRALAANVTQVVFDRNAYKYHGRVKALAEGAREGGLQF
ncbi:50S ribosomal protein L18 [Rhodothermus marinus]|uniref:Large ribosomal subunit protein uL18 n=1 Tax=Rhodothermus marinus (strain ATCC 43812 / DSM 4252 / R-10) TaxID=518766 RepID=D0MGX0_RHOM4|nr:50S ribosomal protein L18 [Rhodothermus marinus]ACY47755.1 ribosomal protein L18 [Rhodothermus marinus DSM 4252]